MTSPQQQLDQLIDDLQQGKPISPQTAEETLTTELIQLGQQFDLNPNFDDVLKGQTTVLPLPNTRPRRLQWVATFVIGLIGVMVLFATVPALRVLAEDIIAELFPRDTQTQRVEENKEFYFSFVGDDTYGAESLDDLSNVIDFELKLPDLSDTDYVFRQGSYVIPRNTVSWNYTLDGNFPSLRIRQQPIDDSAKGVFYFTTEQDTISPEAETTFVTVGAFRGELVQGDWFTSKTGSNKTYYFWKEDAPVYRLRWQDEEFLYEVELWTQDKTASDDIISIAVSMMG